MAQMRTLTINGEKYDIIPVLPADNVTLLASAWVANEDTYSQVVDVPGVTANTKIDLQPTPEQLEEFHYKVLAFVAENDGGTVTVFAVGDKPENDHTIQITKTEVEGVGKIRGNTVGTTMPRPDWNQTDPKMADYILNKPFIPESAKDVGARPDTWTPTADEVGARPDTWLPTIEEIGAAPAGYGLGGGATFVTDLNTALGNGFYYWGTDAVNAPFSPANGGGAMLVIARDGANYVDQIAFDNAQPSYIPICVRQKVAGTWSAWVDCSPSAFAPSGYGLGSSIKKISGVASLNAATANGWYYVSDINSETEVMQGVYFGYALLHVTGVDAYHVKQLLYPAGTSYVLQRTMNATVWEPWEIDNPPMYPGVEYRTTERWNGKPVYKQAFEFTMPNNTFVRAYPPTDILWAESTIVEFSGVIVSGSNMYTFPATDLSGSTAPFSSIMAYAASGKVCFKCQASGDMSACTAKIIVSYVKN